MGPDGQPERGRSIEEATLLRLRDTCKYKIEA